MNKNKIYNVWFSVPALALYLVLFISPVILNFGYSLTNWNAIKLTGETAKYIGMRNFQKIFQDPELTAIQAYDVWKEKKLYGKVSMGVVRSTYVIDEDGVIEKVFEKAKPDTNAQEILDYLDRTDRED